VSNDDGATSAVVSIISIEGRGEGGEGVYVSKRSDRLVVDDAIDRVTGGMHEDDCSQHGSTDGQPMS
jgi:hypothetical protein